MHSFYLPPGTLELIAVTGPDAARLLQGQLTCDVDAIADPGFARGAVCNNKGRVLATFILVRQAEAFYLVLNAGLSAVFMQTLKKFLPFYKCTMQQAEGTLVGAVGTACASALADTQTLPEGGQCASAGDGWTCNLDAAQQQFLVYRPAVIAWPEGLDAGSLTEWHVVGMQSGQFPFTADDMEKYTPQELHLDRNGYVSFTKGCYTGQEIVARMHYRGKVKKQLYLLEGSPAVSPDAVMEILDGAGTPLGSSFRALQAAGSTYLLAHLPADIDGATVGTVKNQLGQELQLRVF
jgi:folate-binding protein YgfZ